MSRLGAVVLWVVSLPALTARAGDLPSATDDPPTADTPVTDGAPPTETPAPVTVRDTASVLSGEVTMSTSGSLRSTAEEFLVLPEGAEVGGQLRTITADDGLGTGKLKLTDLALFDMNMQWAIAHHFELDAAASVLAKQPSATSEHVFQGGSVTLRRDLVARTALALTGSAGPLLGLRGFVFGNSLFVTHKHRLNEIVTFSLAAGATSTFVRPTGAMDAPMLVEGAGHGGVLCRMPNGMWGGWLDVGYALPAFHRGHDPVSNMPLDPQPRLDVTLGTATQLADQWDLLVELSIIDRGDLSNPATRLPVLDGGFDQIQITVGVSRRLDFSKDSHRRGISDPLQML